MDSLRLLMQREEKASDFKSYGRKKQPWAINCERHQRNNPLD